MEHVVQPADGATVSRNNGWAISVYGLWGAAGHGKRGGGEPQRSRAGDAARLVSGGAERERIHGGGWAGSEHYLLERDVWNGGAFQPAHGTEPGCESVAGKYLR